MLTGGTPALKALSLGALYRYMSIEVELELGPELCATDGSVAVTSYEQSRETCPESQGHICVPGPFSFQRF